MVVISNKHLFVQSDLFDIDNGGVDLLTPTVESIFC